TSWSSSFARLAQGSWFSATERAIVTRGPQTAVAAVATSSPRICSPSSLSLWHAITDSVRRKTGGTKKRDSDCPPPPPSKKQKKKKSDKPPAGKVIRIRLYPTPEQDTVLKQWFGTARWTYNRCLDEVKRCGIERSKTALRAACLNRDAFEGKEDLKWVLDTPYDVRDEAMNDLLKAYQTNFAKCRKNPGHTFEV